ncbi:MAG TPA: MFS transporter [Solirubrobacteraceae bacterium]|jgi:MFS family permease|nr:MFS transporter [Solirubrobacteraceae bacterium]
MSDVSQAPARERKEVAGLHLTTGTLIAAALAVLVAQVALAIPAVLNGLFQQDLGTSSSQLTWISDAFLVPVTLLELSFGVLGDLFGRKRLLLIGAGTMMVGEIISVLTPGAPASTGSRVVVLWIGQAIAGIGAAALFPTTLAMIAAGTHTAQERGRAIAVWAAALSTGGFVSPLLGGLMAKVAFGSDPNASWRWAFICVAALSLLSFIVSFALARNSSSPLGRSLDWPGQITVAVALFALLFAIIQGPTSGWDSAEVVLGFIVAVVFLVLFIAVERRRPAPLLRLDLFSNRAFAVTALVTVVGMFAFLGTAYDSSVRLSAIQGFTPLKTSIAFVLLQGMTLAQVPLTARLLPRVNPRWMLTGGFLLMAIGDFWLSALSAAHLSIAPVIPPLIIVGIGFAFCISSVTAVAVNTVPEGLEGMASGTTSLLRDFGFTLGPAIVGAVALSRAASNINARVASSPPLQRALNAFYAAPAHVPADQRAKVGAAVGAVKSGPLGQNAVPAQVPGPGGHVIPFNPLKHVAFHALDQGYSIGYVVCGAAAAVAFLLAALALGGHGEAREPLEESQGRPQGEPAMP